MTSRSFLLVILALSLSLVGCANSLQETFALVASDSLSLSVDKEVVTLQVVSVKQTIVGDAHAIEIAIQVPTQSIKTKLSLAYKVEDGESIIQSRSVVNGVAIFNLDSSLWTSYGFDEARFAKTFFSIRLLQYGVWIPVNCVKRDTVEDLLFVDSSTFTFSPNFLKSLFKSNGIVRDIVPEKNAVDFYRSRVTEKREGYLAQGDVAKARKCWNQLVELNTISVKLDRYTCGDELSFFYNKKQYNLVDLGSVSKLIDAFKQEI